MIRAGILEETGIVAEGQRRLAVFGRFIGQPNNRSPNVDEITRPLLVKISGLEAEIGQLRDKNGDLNRRIAHLRNKLDGLGFVPNGNATVESVQEDFLSRLRREGYEAAGEPMTLKLLCSSHKRLRAYVIPRHICIWAAHRICTRESLVRIGKPFGMDHTSVMHAVRRASDWMKDPFWRRMGRETLEAFGKEVGDAHEPS